MVLIVTIVVYEVFECALPSSYSSVVVNRHLLSVSLASTSRPVASASTRNVMASILLSKAENISIIGPFHFHGDVTHIKRL